MKKVGITLDGKSLELDSFTTIGALREQYGIKPELNIWTLSAPPIKLLDTDRVQDGDQLVTRTNHQVINE